MTMIRFLPHYSVLAAALALAGCGEKSGPMPNAGVGTSASVGVDSTERATTSIERSASTEDSASASVQMAAWGLLVEAAKEFLADNARGTGQCTDDMGPLKGAADDIMDWDALINDGACGSALAMAEMIRITSLGGGRWPRGILPNLERAAAWSRPYAKIVETVNAVSFDLIKAAGSQTLRDLGEAKDRLRAALVEAAKSGRVIAAWRKADVSGPYVANFSGGQKYPVEFVIGGTTYGWDQGGWHIGMHGVDWFGNGNINGRTITVAMQAGASTGLAQRESDTLDEGSSLGSESRSEAGVR